MKRLSNLMLSNSIPTNSMRCLLAMVVICAGCEKRTAEQHSRFPTDDSDFVLVLVLDLSTSSVSLFDDDKPGYEFTMKLIEHYTRAVPGRNGRLILAQVSASDNPLLWEGEAGQLRRDFSNPRAFREKLLSKSNPHGSRIHEGLARTFEYLLKHQSVQGGAKPAVFVLSDMMDNGKDGAEYEKKLVASLKEFGEKGGISGFYFVDQSLLTKWQTILNNAGIKECFVTPDIVADPPMPNFD